MKRSIKLMADYDCWPLWNQHGSEIGNIDPSSLSLSDALVQSLNDWTAQFNSILNRNDPSSSNWPSVEVQTAFVNQGRQLAHQLKTELGTDTEVVYFDESTKKLEAV